MPSDQATLTSTTIESGNQVVVAPANPSRYEAAIKATGPVHITGTGISEEIQPGETWRTPLGYTGSLSAALSRGNAAIVRVYQRLKAEHPPVPDGW